MREFQKSLEDHFNYILNEVNRERTTSIDLVSVKEDIEKIFLYALRLGLACSHDKKLYERIIEGLIKK